MERENCYVKIVKQRISVVKTNFRTKDEVNVHWAEMFETIKKAAGTVILVAGRAKNTFDYLTADASTKERMRRAAKERELLETNDKWISVLCRACGFHHRVNSIYGGDTLTCDCGAPFETPNYVDFVESEKKKAQMKRARSENRKQKTEYHDLQSAIHYFNKKSDEIKTLPINEDEKEMLLIKLQKKRENVLDEFI